MLSSTVYKISAVNTKDLSRTNLSLVTMTSEVWIWHIKFCLPV